MAFCSFVKVRLTRLNPSLSLLPFFVKIFLLSLSLSSCFLFANLKKGEEKKKERSNGRRKKGGGRWQHGSRGERTKEIIRVDELGTPRTTVRRQVFFQRHTFQLAEFRSTILLQVVREFGYLFHARYPSRKKRKFYFQIYSHPWMDDHVTWIYQ